jgi:hypothetical protein
MAIRAPEKEEAFVKFLLLALVAFPSPVHEDKLGERMA